MLKLLKILFSPMALLLLSLVFLIIAETSANRIVHDDGVHAAGFLFAGLVLTRMRFRYYIADPISEKY